MIAVRYEANTGLLRCTGHAGYAEAGGDIVCAAVSGILYTLLANLPGDCVETWEPGNLLLRCDTAQERAAARFCLRGLAVIAEEYPQCVALRGCGDILAENLIL